MRSPLFLLPQLISLHAHEEPSSYGLHLLKDPNLLLSQLISIQLMRDLLHCSSFGYSACSPMRNPQIKVSYSLHLQNDPHLLLPQLLSPQLRLQIMRDLYHCCSLRLLNLQLMRDPHHCPFLSYSAQLTAYEGPYLFFPHFSTNQPTNRLMRNYRLQLMRDPHYSTLSYCTHPTTHEHPRILLHQQVSISY